MFEICSWYFVADDPRMVRGRTRGGTRDSFHCGLVIDRPVPIQNVPAVNDEVMCNLL